jgi:hypothetical protein
MRRNETARGSRGKRRWSGILILLLGGTPVAALGQEPPPTIHGKPVVVRATYSESAAEPAVRRRRMPDEFVVRDHVPEILPAPTPTAGHAVPHGSLATPALHPHAVPAGNLWAGYGGTCGCEETVQVACEGRCQQRPGQQRGFKKVLGKLAAGFDLLMFGHTPSAHCDCGPGQSVDAVCDGACDSIEPLHLHAHPHPHPHAHVHSYPNGQQRHAGESASPHVVQPREPGVVPRPPLESAPRTEPRPEVENPFQDDPLNDRP